MMNRRFFIRLLGFVPFVTLAAKLRALPEPAMELSNSGLTLEKLKAAAVLLDANEVGAERRVLYLSKEQCRKIHKDAFTEHLEAEGKLVFDEHIDVLPHGFHCVQIRHSQGPIERYHYLESDDDLDKMLPKAREYTRTALRRYWAQQMRWKRKASRGLAR
jgi:hypothetical protein